MAIVKKTIELIYLLICFEVELECLPDLSVFVAWQRNEYRQIETGHHIIAVSRKEIERLSCDGMDVCAKQETIAGTRNLRGRVVLGLKGFKNVKFWGHFLIFPLLIKIYSEI